MTDQEFTFWATERGLSERNTKEILLYAATPEEMQEACDKMDPAPPIYTLADIVEMTDTNPFGFSARDSGFVVVGACPNGDPIAIDVAYEPGSVWYICHETMHGKPVREVAVRVAADLSGMFEGMEEGNLPFDYFDAKNQESKSDS
jgi:hypothetical protein